MDVNLSEAREFIVIVGNRSHKTELEKLGRKGELRLNVLERNHPYMKSHSGASGEVCFRIDRTDYFFRGKVRSRSEDSIIVTRESLVGTNGRREIRHMLPTLPANLKERGSVPPRSIEAHIYDLSRNGAKLATRNPLLRDGTYRLESSFPLGRGPKPFLATCCVRYSIKDKDLNLAGVLFMKTTPKDKGVLSKYLTQVARQAQIL